MDREPIKNINSTLHDIRHPAVKYRAESAPTKPRITRKRRKHRDYKKIGSVVLTLTLLLGGYGFFASGAASRLLDKTVISILGEPLGEVAVSDFTPDILKQMPNIMGNLKEVTGAVRGISSGLDELSSHGLALAFNGQGEEFLDILKKIHSNLGTLVNLDLSLPSAANLQSSLSGADGRDLFSSLNGIYSGLGAVIDFLDTPEERRLVFLFQNHSEIRPTGGFVGSYADVTVKRGSVENIKVDDIYTPDRHSSYKVIPPTQLQGITPGWGARDANWFFDYPTSAEKVLEFLEASDLYAPQDTKFDGAIAINAKVISDMLGIVGPIELPDYGVTLTKDNFIFIVRDQIEEARDENPKENPKQILGAAAPILIERLQRASSDQKGQIILDILSRAASKDIQFYFRDKILQSLVEQTPFSGKVFNIPDVFSGDYLAVVDTNVAGGKADLFVKQSINVNSQLFEDGRISNDVTVTREHTGDSQTEALYRAKDQNYIKIFTMPGSEAQFVQGVTPKTVVPQVDYKDSGYSVDPVLASVEDTHKTVQGLGIDQYIESGKTVFGAWFSTIAGDTNTFKLLYNTSGAIVHNDARFQFVFDKQSGVDSSLDYKVSAPAGYIWKESGTSLYEYSDDGTSMPARLVLSLTLVNNE